MSRKQRRHNRNKVTAKGRKIHAENTDTSPALPKLHRPSKFATVNALCDYAKKSVYQITRIRGDSHLTLGTGFLVARNRMMTCAHCIDNPERPNEPMSHHQDGDIYCILHCDEDKNFHYFYVKAKNDVTLHTYPAEDIAILSLPDEFYGVDGNYFQHPDRYLELANKAYSIGADIVILGYPIEHLKFTEEGLPDLNSVILRGDKGVVNTRYNIKIEETEIEVYQFTTPFNPGNSGGPIIDALSGRVIGIVKGSLTIPIRQVEDAITDLDESGNLKVVMQKSMAKTTYSVGFSVRNCFKIAANHDIKFAI